VSVRMWLLARELPALESMVFIDSSTSIDKEFESMTTPLIEMYKSLPEYLIAMLFNSFTFIAALLKLEAIHLLWFY